jgi:hypothetical protein
LQVLSKGVLSKDTSLLFVFGLSFEKEVFRSKRYLNKLYYKCSMATTTTTREGNRNVTRDSSGTVIRSSSISTPAPTQAVTSRTPSGGATNVPAPRISSSSSSSGITENQRRAELERQGYTTVEANAIIKGIPVDPSIQAQRTGQARSEQATFAGRIGNTFYSNLTEQELLRGQLDAQTSASKDIRQTAQVRLIQQEAELQRQVQEKIRQGQSLSPTEQFIQQTGKIPTRDTLNKFIEKTADPSNAKIVQENLKNLREFQDATKIQEVASNKSALNTQGVIQEQPTKTFREKVAERGLVNVLGRDKLSSFLAQDPKDTQTNFFARAGAQTLFTVTGLGRVVDPLAKFIAKTPEQRKEKLFKVADSTILGLEIASKTPSILAKIDTETQKAGAKVVLDTGSEFVKQIPPLASELGSSIGQQARNDPSRLVGEVAAGFAIGGLISKTGRVLTGANKAQKALKVPKDVRPTSIKVTSTGKPITTTTARGKLETVKIFQEDKTVIKRVGKNFEETTTISGEEIFQRAVTTKGRKKLIAEKTIVGDKADLTVLQQIAKKKPQVIFEKKGLEISGKEMLTPQISLQKQRAVFKRQEQIARGETAILRGKEKTTLFTQGQPTSARLIKAKDQTIPIQNDVSRTFLQIERSIESKGIKGVLKADRVVNTKTLQQLEPKGLTRVQSSKFEGFDALGNIKFGAEGIDLSKAKLSFGKKTEFPDFSIKPVKNDPTRITSLKTPDIRQTIITTKTDITKFRKIPEKQPETTTLIFSSAIPIPVQINKPITKIKATTPVLKGATILKEMRVGKVSLPGSKGLTIPINNLSQADKEMFSVEIKQEDFTKNKIEPLQKTDVNLNNKPKILTATIVDTSSITKSTTLQATTNVNLIQSPMINQPKARISTGQIFKLTETPVFAEFNLKGKDKITQKQQGYDVLVREKGKFVKVNKKPKPFNRAWNLGASVTDNTSAATFKLEKSGMTDLPETFKNQFLKQKFSEKNGKYIEKNKHRIDTPGEIQGITVKGWLAQKTSIFKLVEEKRKKGKQKKDALSLFLRG